MFEEFNVQFEVTRAISAKTIDGTEALNDHSTGVVIVNGSIDPDSQQEQLNDDGTIIKGKLVIYTEAIMFTNQTSPHGVADIVKFDDKKYTIIAVARWEGSTSFEELNHYKVTAEALFDGA